MIHGLGDLHCTDTAKPFLDDDDDEDDDCAAAAADMHQHQPREELLCCCSLAELSLGSSDDPRCCPNKAMMRLQLSSVGLMTRPDSGHTS